MDYEKLFNKLYPDFFEQPRLKFMADKEIYHELVTDKLALPPKHSCPRSLEFKIHEGLKDTLREAIYAVDHNWAENMKDDKVYLCGYSGPIIISFCVLENLGTVGDVKVGGLGCVGTVPAFRNKGIGSEMVYYATNTLFESGYDMVWIHYTHIPEWYEKLGYTPVLRWNKRGFF